MQNINPLVPGYFFLSNFLMKIGGKVHCMNRLGNLKVESRHSIFDHARGKKVRTSIYGRAEPPTSPIKL